MLSLGLSASMQAKFHRALCYSHSVKITVQVLNLTHGYLTDLSHHLTDGQINVDTTADVTRTLSLTVLDPERTLTFDSDSPADGAMYLDRMIKVVYSINSDITGRWIDVPVFTGPVTRMNRSDDLVTILADGKERLLMDAVWLSRVYAKGYRKTSILRDLLVLKGETRFDLGTDISARITAPMSLARDTITWDAMKKAAGPLGAVSQLFYDARGQLVYRRTPQRPVFTFSTGTGGSITSYPQITYNADTIRNTVLVRGAVAKGATKPQEWGFSVPTSLPYSPKALGRNGSSRVLLEIIDDDTVKSKATAQSIAPGRFKSLQLESVDVAFDSLPIPHLQEMDVFTVKTPEFALTCRLNQMTIPLGLGAASVGYTKRVTTNRTKIRKKRR